VFAGGVPRHPVGEPVASAGLDEHPEAQALILLLREHLLELGDRAVRQADRRTTDLKNHVLHLVSSTYFASPSIVPNASPAVTRSGTARLPRPGCRRSGS